MNTKRVKRMAGAATFAAAIALAFLSGSDAASAAGRARIDLDGQWQFRLDPGNEGETARWYSGKISFDNLSYS